MTKYFLFLFSVLFAVFVVNSWIRGKSLISQFLNFLIPNFLFLISYFMRVIKCMMEYFFCVY